MSELDLAREELREMASGVIDAAGDPTEAFGMYVFGADEQASMLARHVERVVFDQWFGNSPELLDAEYGPYEASSVFLTIIDHRRRLPAGMARITFPSPIGFKTLHDIEAIWHQPVADVLGRTGLEWDLTRVCDVLGIAIMPEYRGKATDGLLTVSVLQFVVQSLLHIGGRYGITEIDTVVLEYLQASISHPYQQFPGLEPVRYLDSPSTVPVYVDLEEWMPRLAAADEHLYDILCVQEGIAPAISAPSWDRVTDIVSRARSGRRDARELSR